MKNVSSRRDSSRDSDLRLDHPRARPAEGRLIVALHLAIMATVAWSVARIDHGAYVSILIGLSVWGALFGFARARRPSLESFAHVHAILLGVVLALSTTALRGDGPRDGLTLISGVLQELYSRVSLSIGVDGGERLSNDSQFFVVGLVLWLVGYTSAWCLLRFRSSALSISLPLALALVHLSARDDSPAVPAVGLFVTSLMLVTRHHAFLRQTEWHDARIPQARGLARRITMSGSLTAIVVLFVGWLLPATAPTAFSETFDRAGLIGRQQLRPALDRMPMLGSRVGSSSGFSAFGESFELGLEFTPSEELVASVRADEPAYLVLRRYDDYTGRGWTTGVDTTFQAATGKSAATSVLELPADTAISYSALINHRREPHTVEVVLIQPRKSLLFTVDLFQSADVDSTVLSGWVAFERLTVDTAARDFGNAPPELGALLEILKGAEFRPDEESGLPVATDPDVSATIEAERSRLLEDFGIDTSLGFDSRSHLILSASGGHPNFDDVEAVGPGGDIDAPERYTVTGSRSVATHDELILAGDEYPTWVKDRYLSIADSVTNETGELALNVVQESGAQTAFDKAWAIQQYLRQNFTYDENSAQAPDGRDAVDFFLFGKRIGRCEDYATAMVVMLRKLEIPARLAAGYAASNEIDDGGDYLYRERQAHTWVEVFFPGYGWIPFEPTPSLQSIQYGVAGGPAPTTNVMESPSREATPIAEKESVADATAIPSLPAAMAHGDDSRRGWRGTPVLLGALSLAMAGLVLRVASRRRSSERDPPRLRAGAELYAKAARAWKSWGVELDPATTPMELAAAAGRAVPSAARATRVVAELYYLEQYGGVELDDNQRRLGATAWRAIQARATTRPQIRRRRRRGADETT